MSVEGYKIKTPDSIDLQPVITDEGEKCVLIQYSDTESGEHWLFGMLADEAEIFVGRLYRAIADARRLSYPTGGE